MKTQSKQTPHPRHWWENGKPRVHGGRIRRETLAQDLLLALIAVAPIPFGANRPWAWNGGLILIGIVLILRGTISLRLEAWVWWAVALLAVVPVWGVCQALPGVPEALWHPLWQETGGEGFIGLDPRAALDGALRFLGYGVVLVLAAEQGRSCAFVDRLVRVIACSGMGVALYGLLLMGAGHETVLGVAKISHLGVLTATFPNRNATAACLGLGLLAAVAWTLRRLSDQPPGQWSDGGLLRRGGFPLVAVAVQGGALFLTASRGGIAAAGCGLLILVGLFRAAGKGKSERWAVPIVIVTGLFLVSGTTVMERWTQTRLDHLDRTPIYRAVAEGIETRPLLGQGLGSFDTAFMMWRPEGVGRHWDKAHSSWLENAFELGIPVTVCLALGLAVVLRSSLRGLRHTSRPEVVALAVAAAGQAALHSGVDFAYQFPANALWAAALLGVGAGSVQHAGVYRPSFDD